MAGARSLTVVLRVVGGAHYADRTSAQIPAYRFPAQCSPDRTNGQVSDSGMTGLRVRQLKPRAAPELAPVQPMALAAPSQHPDPLQLHLAPNSVESGLAVMKSE